MTKQNSPVVARLSWLCLALAILLLAGFAWYVPQAHDRFRSLFKATLPGFPGFVRGLPSAAFIGIAVGLAGLSVFAQVRLKDRAAASVVHLIVIVVALSVFVAHREAVFGGIMGFTRLIK